jgi:uncharacterized protein (DUF488 family)
MVAALKNYLYTLGYEGLDIETFVARLASVGAKIVVDVRELPLSRKRGFSKSSFRAVLAAAGIEYCHVPQLGCPKSIRNQYKLDGDWNAYTCSFLSYVSTQVAPIRELAKLANTSAACLVCFEADFSLCHRSFVARAARKHGGPVVMHLTAKTALPDLDLRVAA